MVHIKYMTRLRTLTTSRATIVAQTILQQAIDTLIFCTSVEFVMPIISSRSPR